MITHFLRKTKDGGPNSPVDAYFLIEIKGLFSIALLKFNRGCREEYHTHAFNAWTWFLKGHMAEEKVSNKRTPYTRSIVPKYTTRANLHRVIAYKESWCFTIRGPWTTTWKEYNKKLCKTTTFTHGRKVVVEVYDYD